MKLRLPATALLVTLGFAAGCGDGGPGTGAPGGAGQVGSGGATTPLGGMGAASGNTSSGGASGGAAVAGMAGAPSSTGGESPGQGGSAGGSDTGGVQNRGGEAGQATAGSGGSSSGAGGQATAGTGGVPTTGPQGVLVTSHDLPVPSGKVFNVADNYFRDTFIPPTPVANFGLHSQIIAVPADDGSLDVAWLDYTNGNGSPWSVSSPSTIYLTHIAPDLGSATTVSSGITSYKLLGFTKDSAGASYLAYNKDHAFKTNQQDNPNNLNGNELHVAKLNGTSLVWDKLLFGNQDNALNDTKGDPGGAASGVLGYDPTHQTLVLYCGHSMMWTPTRHQAGFLRLLDPATGAVLPPAGNDVIHFGSGWFYSHNFNQRLLIDGGNYYVLAHGDAYARQLGFARWSKAGYTNANAPDFDASYFAIAGNSGDNKTDSQTGQLVKMPDGRFLIVHTTSQGRSARDVRLIFASANSGNASGAVWLTSNQGTTHATMPKVELLGEHVLVTYALWDSTKGHALTWYAALLDQELATVVTPHVLTGVEFVDSAPLFRFKGGPNAGAVGWVSGNASHTLSVRVATTSY